MNELRVVYLGDRRNVAETLINIPGYKLTAWIFEASDFEKEEILSFCEKRRVLGLAVNSKKELHEALKKLKRVDLGVITNFGIILSQETIALSNKGFVNIHLGALPEYPGRNPVRDALKKGEKTLGVTLHRVTEKVDGGEIIAQKWVAKGEKNNIAEILERIGRVVPDILKENLPL